MTEDTEQPQDEASAVAESQTNNETSTNIKDDVDIENDTNTTDFTKLEDKNSTKQNSSVTQMNKTRQLDDEQMNIVNTSIDINERIGHKIDIENAKHVNENARVGQKTEKKDTINDNKSQYVHNIMISKTGLANDKVDKEATLLSESKTIVRFSPIWRQVRLLL